MINKFEKQLEKWNGGVLRGAQAKLAKLLQVSTATVALWATGKRHPSKGYIAQMSQLFGLDPYDVVRLFAPTTTYPEPAAAAYAAKSLRDAQRPENTYKADFFSQPQSNSISLPLLAVVPADSAHPEKGEVLEWWTLPLPSAKGAKYLLRGPLYPAKTADVYFIKPTDQLTNKTHMLLRINGQYQLAKTPLKNAISSSEVIPLGIVVRKITDVL